MPPFRSLASTKIRRLFGPDGLCEKVRQTVDGLIANFDRINIREPTQEKP